MGVKRKQHSAKLKARVAMTALSGEKTPGGAVGGVWGSSDDDQQLEAGAGDACGGAVRAAARRIIHRRNEGITIEQRILNCASNLCEHPSGVWQLIRRRTIPTRRYLIDEAFAALLEYKMHNIQISAYIAEQKRQEVINEKGLLYPILERAIEESNPLPMEEVRDILKIAEDRHQRLIANMTTLLAGLTGAAIGAGLTYLLTRTGSLGLDWMMFL